MVRQGGRITSLVGCCAAFARRVLQQTQCFRQCGSCKRAVQRKKHCRPSMRLPAVQLDGNVCRPSQQQSAQSGVMSAHACATRVLCIRQCLHCGAKVAHALLKGRIDAKTCRGKGDSLTAMQAVSRVAKSHAAVLGWMADVHGPLPQVHVTSQPPSVVHVHRGKKNSLCAGRAVFDAAAQPSKVLHSPVACAAAAGAWSQKGVNSSSLKAQTSHDPSQLKRNSVKLLSMMPQSLEKAQPAWWSKAGDAQVSTHPIP